MILASSTSGKNIENATIKISKDLGFKYEKTLKLTLSSIAGKGYKYEPIFVFKKYGDEITGI